MNESNKALLFLQALEDVAKEEQKKEQEKETTSFLKPRLPILHNLDLSLPKD